VTIIRLRSPYLLTAVLQITHERFLDAVEFSKLDIDRFPCALQILCALGKVLTSFNTGRRDGKCTLQTWDQSKRVIDKLDPYLQLLVDAFQAVD